MMPTAGATGYSPMSESPAATVSPPGLSPQRNFYNGSSVGSLDGAASVMGRQLALEQQQNPNQAARACEKCRSSKRKCDKKLPFCDRCKRLNAKCHYVQDPLINNPNAHGAQLVLFQPHTISNDLLLRGAEPLEGISPSQILSLVSSGATQGGPQIDWRTAINLFFHCIHSWYAVVHPQLFHHQLHTLLPDGDHASPSDSQASPYSNGHNEQQTVHKLAPHLSGPELRAKELALLIVAMYLTTRMRLTDAGEQHMFDETYRSTKRMLALLLMGCADGPLPSIELVQCGALIALYEYGHGDIETAYRTLSQTVAVARVLDVKPGEEKQDNSGDVMMAGHEEQSREEVEQNGCLWWGMFILEQFIHQDEATRHLPFVLASPSQDTLLPDTPPITPAAGYTGSLPGPSFPAPNATQNLRTSVDVGSHRLGSFQLSAKVSSLFHRALVLDKQRSSRQGPQIRLSEELDSEVRQASAALVQQSLHWEHTLDCFAMLSSTLFVLYSPYLQILENVRPADIDQSNELSTAVAALRLACKISTDISCKVNLEFSGQIPSGPAVICAPAGATCYLVILAFSRMCRIFPEEHVVFQRAIADKFESLWLFSFRWGIAEKMMSQLEQTGLNRDHYLKNVSARNQAITAAAPSSNNDTPR
ncbi:hypothetical protein F4780DRAFT_677277 [Xylariomycetidae sp. FL0641]|nr:hypothetical protein F4780DRAFT_677277 [Xylariomycetidae sp. FL0641]